MRAVNPATEEVIHEYPEHSPSEVRARLDRAAAAFQRWRRTSFADRARLLHSVAGGLRAGRERWARTMTEEMGKPIGAALAEVEKCAWVCEFYADNAERFLAPVPVATDASKSFVRYDPLGPILAVMPWNFPYWQVFRFAAPALMAGNVALLKHASNVPGSALAIAEVFRSAGTSEGVFAALLVPASVVPALIDDPVVRAVTLTGSDAAGMAIGARAGAALKKTVLELGGSDPFLVLEDADLDAAAGWAAKARTINNGQSCIAAKRFIVVGEVAERFEAALADRLRALRVGDPMDPAIDVGPLAREDLLADLHAQVERSVQAGARLVTGGRRIKRRGYFYPPTMLVQVEPGMAAFDEETFGPVAAVVRARDAAHAVELANRSPYGLGASIWTGDPRRGEELAAEIEAGCVFVNGMVKSDPRLPFGGVKRSGYGRELAEAGIREFTNVKTVWVK